MVRESRIWNVNQEKAIEIWNQVDLREIETVIREYNPQLHMLPQENLYLTQTLYTECIILHQPFLL